MYDGTNTIHGLYMVNEQRLTNIWTWGFMGEDNKRVDSRTYRQSIEGNKQLIKQQESRWCKWSAGLFAQRVTPMTPVCACRGSGLDLLMRDKRERIAGILASWVPPSSCNPALPPPPDSGPPAGGRGPGGGTVPAAGEDAQYGSTAPTHWTLRNGICKKANTYKRHKQNRLNYLYDAHAIRFISGTTRYWQNVTRAWRITVNCKCVWINYRRWASWEQLVHVCVCEMSKIHYVFKVLLWRNLCEHTVFEWWMMIYSAECTLCFSLAWMD